jgi:hypothetical protein
MGFRRKLTPGLLNICPDEYTKIYKGCMSILHKFRVTGDAHNIAQEAVQVYLERERKAGYKWCVIDSLRRLGINNKEVLGNWLECEAANEEHEVDAKIDLGSLYGEHSWRLNDAEHVLFWGLLAGYRLVEVAQLFLWVSPSRVSQMHDSLISKLRGEGKRKRGVCAIIKALPDNMPEDLKQRIRSNSEKAKLRSRRSQKRSSPGKG